MTRETSKKGIGRAPGLTPLIKQKSRRRRDTYTALTESATHAVTPRNDLTPTITAERLPIESVKPAARRLRRADKAQAARLDASIATFGQVLPVLINEDCQVVHGHGVLEALKRAGSRNVSVSRVSHLSRAKQRLLAIALNRLGETGQWDEDVVKVEITELIELGEDPVIAGFEVAEIDALLLEDDAHDEETNDDETFVPPHRPTARPGDLWRLGPHRLFCGDALDADSYRLLMADGETARLIASDSPFNVPVVNHVTSSKRHREFAAAHGEMSREEFGIFLDVFLRHATERLVDGGLALLFMDWRSIELLLTVGREMGLSLLNIIVWAKTNGGQGSLWRSQHELIAVFKKGAAAHVNNVALGRSGRWRSNVWTYPGGSSLGSDARESLSLHPTVKPRALLEDALLDVTNPGDVVLDPFVGSGSTILACETTRRVCRAIEIDAAYCDVAIRGWQTLTGEAATLVETGEAFDQVAARRGAPPDGAQGDEQSSVEELSK